jgi:hypothetical protein
MEGIDMTDADLRVSRRKLLKATSFASLAALVACGASDDQLERESRTLVNIPNTAMAHLVDLAKHAPVKLKDSEVAKFKLAVRMLWKKFEDGTLSMEIDDLYAVLDAAYNKVGKKHQKKFGDFLVENLGEWDSSGNDPVTNRCAVICGWKAYKRGKANGDKIDATIFNGAFEDTEDEVGSFMARARSIAEAQGKTPVESKGNGC